MVDFQHLENMLKVVITLAWIWFFALGSYGGYIAGALPDADPSLSIVVNTRVFLWIIAITILAIGATWFGMRLLSVDNKSNNYVIWRAAGAFDPGMQTAQLGYWFILGLCGAIYFLLGSLVGYQVGLYL